MSVTKHVAKWPDYPELGTMSAYTWCLKLHSPCEDGDVYVWETPHLQLIKNNHLRIRVHLHSSMLIAQE